MFGLGIGWRPTPGARFGVSFSLGLWFSKSGHWKLDKNANSWGMYQTYYMKNSRLGPGNLF